MLSFVLQMLTLSAGTGIAVLLLGVLRDKFGVDNPVASLIVLAGALLLLLFQSIVSFTLLTQKQLAEEFDRRQHFLERLTTYLQLRDSDHPFLLPLIIEMESKLDGVSAFRSSRFASGFAGPLGFIVFVLCASLIAHSLPESPKAMTRREERAVVRKEAAKLQKTANDLAKAKNPELEKLLNRFKRSAREMLNGQTTKAEALKTLHSMNEQLRAEQDRLSRDFEKQKGQIVDSQQQSVNPNRATRNDRSEDSEHSGNEKPFNGKMDDKGAATPSDAARQEKLRKAMEDYKAQKERSGKEMEALSKALDEAHRGMTHGGNPWTANSEVPDREMEEKKGGVQDGPGTTNKDLGPQHFDTHKENQSEYLEDRTKAKYDELYKGQREDVKTEPLFLDHKWNDDSDRRYVNVRTFGVNRNSRAGASGSGAITNDLDTGESAIRKERIPASYSKIVNQYFQSIKADD